MKISKKQLIKNLNFNFIKFFGILLFTCLLFTQVNVLGQSKIGEKTCVECHKDAVKKDILHGPTATDCTACHVSNGAKHPLENVTGFIFLEEGANLCYSCHEEAQTEFKKKYVHKPVKKGKCTECHEVHSSNNHSLIFEQSPDLCFSCHNEFEELKETSMSVHQPSFDGKSCLICHTPHASSQKRLLVENSKQLCLNCHNKTIEYDNREIANISKQLDETSHIHKALKKRCTSCHNPHFSNKNKQLLKETYPLGNYAKGIEENYSLCFNCHDTDMLNLETTTTATEFRDGDVNLHYLHLNKEKGRTCTNCHDAHSANNNKLIAKTRKFGRWNMPLEFTENESGGTCTGCHKALTYSRGK
ncbi:cytochrome c3 family protein [Lutibacter sp.]